MEKFLNYMNSNKIVSEKKARFYWIGVSKFMNFSNDKLIGQINDNDINRYIYAVPKGTTTTLSIFLRELSEDFTAANLCVGVGC